MNPSDVHLTEDVVGKLRNLRKPATPLQERNTAALESIAANLDIIRQRFEVWDSVGDQD